MTIAIGDIHGCLTPLKRLIPRLPKNQELVFLGDFIDRGPNSAGVVRFLRELSQQRPCRFLLGNHEVMMLQAIAEPAAKFNWLFNGGAATLGSYDWDPKRWDEARDKGAFLEDGRPFFSSLESFVETASHIFVHAGIDLDIPEMASQEIKILVWTRENFYCNGRKWQGKPIVFGHTPTETLGLRQGEVFRSGAITGIDTGCVYGGVLTALNTDTGEVYQENSDFPRGP